MNPKCYHCDRLERKEFPGGLVGRVRNIAYRCSAGKYDIWEGIDGNKIPRYFAWGGVLKLNKSVAAAQLGCLEFEEAGESRQ